MRKPVIIIVFGLLLVLLVFSACSMTPPASPTLVSPVTPSPVPTTPVPPTQTPTAQSISEASIAEIRDWLAGLTGQDLFTGSILIAEQGKILLAEGYNLADRANKLPNTASTRYQIGSITKQFTAMAVMILAGQGKLGIEQVSGQTYEEFLQQNVFTPLALHNAGFDDPNSNLAIGYINSHSNIPAVPDLLAPLAARGRRFDLYH